MLALACGSIAFAQVPLPPVTPPDSAAKAAALPPPGGEPIDQMLEFASGSRWHLTVNATFRYGLVITGAQFPEITEFTVYLRVIRRAYGGNLCPLSRWYAPF